ncbi:hypothetical protein GF337_04550 [candidate division KSB1 bacterium]|nr:hypothetical protein [candidate division KSB1 bacterium]
MDKYKTWELTLKTLVLFGGLVTAIWAYFTYTDTKEKEFYTFYWNRKLELFLETSQAASQMATTDSLEVFKKARSEYMQLFYGRLSLVEGRHVKEAMEEFSNLVPLEPEPDLPRYELLDPAYNLTIALKRELLISWQNPFSELAFDTTHSNGQQPVKQR